MAARCVSCRVREPRWGSVCDTCRAEHLQKSAMEARMVQSHLIQDIENGLGLGGALRDPRAAGIRVIRILKCYHGLRVRNYICDEARLDSVIKVRDLTNDQILKIVEASKGPARAPRQTRPTRAKVRADKGKPFVRRTVETPEGKRLRLESERMKQETLARMAARAERQTTR